MPVTIKIRPRLSLSGVSHTHYLGEGTMVPVDPKNYVVGYKDTRVVGYRRDRAYSYKDARVEGRKRTRAYGYKHTLSDIN